MKTSKKAEQMHKLLKIGVKYSNLVFVRAPWYKRWFTNCRLYFARRRLKRAFTESLDIGE